MDNNDGLTWDVGKLAESAAGAVAAANLAAMIAAFHKNLRDRGLTREEATKLTCVFLDGYWQMATAQQKAKG